MTVIISMNFMTVIILFFLSVNVLIYLYEINGFFRVVNKGLLKQL